MGQVFTVETAQASDLTEIDALFARSYPALLKDHYPPSLRVTAIPMIARAKPELVATGTYFVVRDAHDIVGAGGWTRSRVGPLPGQSASIGNIRHVVTDHTRVREGIGRKLMDHIFADARKQGILRMDCLSTRMAVPFYQACGFTKVGDSLIPLAAGIEFPAVAMQRDI